MKLYSLFLLLFGSLALPSFVLAQDASLDTNEVQARMKGRLPDLVAMKMAGHLGEARNGLLAIRGQITKEQEKIVHLENKDRRAVYEYMAKKFDIPVPQVAMSRAAKIRKAAKPGTWVQEKGGAWVKVTEEPKE
jgi:uncharacterized protein YdbL (DUF1318 family)